MIVKRATPISEPGDMIQSALPSFRVSRETVARLSRYAEMVGQWQRQINLVAPATISELWSRHILDSVQLFALKPSALRWVDIGSGGGFPGLVIAIFLAESAGGVIDLVESNNKKAAFLRHVAGELCLPARIHADRAESVLERVKTPEIVTARALASLEVLLTMTNLLLKSGAVGLFPKGRGYEQELTAARKSWHFSCEAHPSVTDADARILEITV